MIVTKQKWFMVSTLSIQDNSVQCCGATVAGGLCIIAIRFSLIRDQTSVIIQFYYVDYYYDIWMKPGIQ
jgi:hypothetical protein